MQQQEQIHPSTFACKVIRIGIIEKVGVNNTGIGNKAAKIFPIRSLIVSLICPL